MLFFRQILLQIYKSGSRMILMTAVLLILFSTFAAYGLEPDTFGNPFNAFWWVMTTVTTVGYGDYYPHSVAGKCLGIFLYIAGISLISVVISKVVDSVLGYHRKKEEGKLRYGKENHFVIIGWSGHAELAVKEILASDPQFEIVIVDQLEKTPVVHERIHYVRGNPVHKETLDAANLEKVKAVFLFADEVTDQQTLLRDTSFIDGKTLLIATSIERHYQSVYTIVEIRDRDNIPNFQYVQVDEFILSSEMVPQLAVRAAFHPGASKIMSQLLTREAGDDLYEVRKKPHWVRYRDAFEELLAQGATLISDGEHMDINRRLDEPIRDNARLFVICDAETHARIAG